MDYNKITLEQLFIYYHNAHIGCECNADNKEIKFVEE